MWLSWPVTFRFCGNANWEMGNSPFSCPYMLSGLCTMCLPFHEAVQILDLFREQFIEEMDADAVVLELLHNNIIDRGDERRITMTVDPTQQNQFLHFILKEKCTEEAFETVCDIITAVKGNPKMKALGESMKRRLETGGYVCVCVCEGRGRLCTWVHVVTVHRGGLMCG